MRSAARWARVVVSAVTVLALTSTIGSAQESRGASSASPLEPESAGAALAVWNHPIITFHAPYESRSAETRASLARARIYALPLAAAQSPVVSEAVRVGSTEAVLVRVAEDVLFVVLPDDVEPGTDLAQEARAAADRLARALHARAEQQRWPVILTGLGRVTLATLAALAALTFFSRLRRVAFHPLERLAALATTRVPWLHPELCARTVEMARAGVAGLLVWTGGLVVLFVWITYALLQFPVTVPLGERLGGRLGDLLEHLATSTVQAVPGLFVAFLILLGARAITRLMALVTSLVSSGAIRVRWLHRDTVEASYRIALVVVWGGALVAAYPYIPGSDSEAFRGLTLLFGVMASLGSAGLAGQAMSGLSAVYSRTLRPGEYVRIGDVQAQVLSVGLLATKLYTLEREELTVPNSVLVTGTTTNYSRLGKGGAVVVLSVGVGYDVPWRQAEALLRLAASRTSSLVAEPPARVQQRALRRFDVEYVLSTFLRPGHHLQAAQSALMANVQDAFNEHGVQLMTPVFEVRPEHPIVVPKDRWHAPPASAPAHVSPRVRRVTGASRLPD